MTLIRYLLREHLRVLALCLFGLVAVYIIVDFIEKIRRFLSYQAEPHLILRYFALKLPSVAFQITPLAILMACLLTLAILSRGNEILAMRSSGVSLYRVTLPFLMVALLVSLVMLWANDALIPRANLQAETLREVQIEGRTQSAMLQGNEIWVRLGSQTLMKGDLADESALKLYGVSLYRLKPTFRIAEMLQAKELRYEDGQWVLLSGVSRKFEADQGVTSRVFDRLPVSLNQKPEDFRQTIRVNPDALSLRALAAYVERLRQGGYNPARYATELHGRMAFPFVCLIMGLIGSAMSLMDTGSRRSGLVRGVGYSLVIGFLYWATHSVALAFGRSGVLPPLLAGWTANLLFLSFASYLFLHIRQ